MIGEVETEEVTQTSQNDKIEREQPQEKNFEEEETEAKDQLTITKPTVPIPYTQSLKKNKLDKQFIKFMEVFKKLHINIPFTDALEQIPSYVKSITLTHVTMTRKGQLMNLSGSNNKHPLNLKDYQVLIKEDASKVKV